MSAATLDSGSKYKKFIRRVDLDLVPDGSMKFFVTVTSASINFVSDLYYTDTNLFEIFSLESSKYYIVSYLRQTLDIKAYK